MNRMMNPALHFLAIGFLVSNNIRFDMVAAELAAFSPGLA